MTRAATLSVKFLCSHQKTGDAPFQISVQSGDYATSISVHNFTGANAPILYEAAEMVSIFEAAPGVIGAIRNLLGLGGTFPDYKAGIVEILSTVELSVTGVYTVKKCTQQRAGDQRGATAPVRVREDGARPAARRPQALGVTIRPAKPRRRQGG